MIGDLALHYTDSQQEGKTILLLHGYLESLEVWDEFAKLLRKAGYRVVALDLPGHGISEVVGETHSMEFLAATVTQLMEKIDVEKATVIGHSMGGYVALALAAAYPGKLDGLVLFHSTPNPDSDEKKADRKREIEIIRAGKKELLSKTSPEKGFARENRLRFKDEIEDLGLQVMLTEDDGIVALLNGMMERKDMNDMLHGLKVPQLLIFGEKDEYITRPVAEEVICRQPQAQVAWLANSGHMGFIEEPEKSLEIIENFVGKA